MSLKIIKIDTNNIGDDLTVDNTTISVDNIIISVDQTEILEPIYTLKIPYRFFSSEVKLLLWNEIKEKEIILNLTVIENNGEMILTFTNDFEDGETYEVKVTDINDKLIWRGKILSTIQTDLENYILHKVDNNIIKI